MAEVKTEEMRITTPPFRLSFPNIAKAKAIKEGQEPTFNIQMLFPKTEDISAMKDLANKAMLAKFGPKKDWPEGYRNPFRDGDKHPKKLENYKGFIFINAKSKFKPGVVDKKKNEILDLSEVYAGCWCRATLTVYAYNTAGNAGVAFGLQNIQKLKDDTAFSGKKNAKDDFDEIDFGEDEAASFEASSADATDF